MKTKEGVEVAVGQIWQDLDKRCSHRRVRILEIGTGKTEGKVRVRHVADQKKEGGRWLSIRRMHNHSTGFALVS